jgi:hypothetical protein
VKKDLKQLLARLVKAGWQVRKTKRGHIKAISPQGELVVMGSTPTDYRGLKNALALLRRKGFNG